MQQILTDNETDVKTGFETDLAKNVQADIQTGAIGKLNNDIKTNPQKGCKKYLIPGICAIDLLTLFIFS